MNKTDEPFTKKYRILLIGLVILLIGISLSAAGALRPSSISGSTGNGTVSISISDYADSNVEIIVSKTFTIDISCRWGADFCYYSAQGKEPINFTFVVLDDGGGTVGTWSGKLKVPNEMEVDSSKSTMKYYDSETNSVSLGPGDHQLEFSTEAQVDYYVNQGFKLSTVVGVGNVMGGIGILIFIVWYFYIRKKVQAPIYHAPPPPPPPAYGYSDPDYGLPITSRQSYGQSSYPSGHSSLQYQEGGYYMELQCASCGNIVRSPPINGVVTCEYCGDRARIY